MAGKWVTTANRGFYYGPSSNNAWNNDVGWKHAIARENRLASKFMEGQLDDDNPKQDLASSKGGTQVSSTSRDTLYRHFDKLSKEEQLAVLRDALGRKDRLDKLESASERFDDAALSGLSSQAKAEKLIKALGNERSNRMKKEAMFAELLQEERQARMQAESAMKELESKLDNLASVMGVPAKQNFLKRTHKRV